MFAILEIAALMSETNFADQWLDQALKTVQPVRTAPHEIELIRRLLDLAAVDETQFGRREILAAAFDLLISVEYYSTLGHVGWVYCPINSSALFYPYTNVCPRCVLEGRFEYHKANKPTSGIIGAATSRLLIAFIQEYLTRQGKPIQVSRGAEPVDVIFVDASVNPPILFFAEIKAAPLTTLPLMVESQLMFNDEGQPIIAHKTTDHPTLYGSPIRLPLPVEWQGHWLIQEFDFGQKEAAHDKQWAYRSLLKLLEDKEFFRKYCHFWRHAFSSYAQRQTTPTYWLTNGCGQPIPRPAEWPTRSGGSTGYETVSDAKTSVGMDRTDDIKKAIYQVLKLGTTGRPSHKYHYKVGVISNIHAVRHFQEYLTPLKDIVWTRDLIGNVSSISQLPPDTQVFNLFDGIVALTETIARDTWIQKVFDFE